MKKSLVSKGLFERIYEQVGKVPMGKVTTYGSVAKAIGLRDVRRVGQALHVNPHKDVPCHRVVNKDGRLAPNFAFDGADEQRRRLMAEGVEMKDEMHVDKQYLWKNGD